MLILHERKLYQDSLQYACMNQKKQHILHICAQYLPSKGGVEEHLWQVNKLLLSDNYQVTVITAQNDSSLPLEEILDGVEVLRISHSIKNKKLQIWQWFWQHKNIFNDKKIFIHDVAWQILPLLPLLYKRFCLVFHGWEGIYPVPKKNILQRRFFATMAKYVIHVGSFIEKFYGDHPDEVIYGGVESFDNQNLKTVASNLVQAVASKNNLQFVFVGRLEAVNEVNKYISFFKELRKSHTLFSVTWVGDGSYRAECLKLGKVTGMIANPAQYLVNADVVCAASYLSIFQAQLKEKIVTSFYSNELKKEYLQTFPGASYMLIADSVSEMKKMLFNVLESKSALLQLQKGAKEVAQQYSWERIASVYEKIANRL